MFKKTCVDNISKLNNGWEITLSTKSISLLAWLKALFGGKYKVNNVKHRYFSEYGIIWVNVDTGKRVDIFYNSWLENRLREYKMTKKYNESKPV